MALQECAQHNLVNPYEVLSESTGALTARFMFTTILMPNGPLKLTNYPYDPACIQSDISMPVGGPIAQLLEQPVRPNNKKK